jgi:hypothetical protein
MSRGKPYLAVVGENLATRSGINFLLDLLKVSWTPATILVSERNDNVIHEDTEGLGILGQIKGYDDLENLEKLLRKFKEIVTRAKPAVSQG